MNVLKKHISRKSIDKVYNGKEIQIFFDKDGNVTTVYRIRKRKNISLSVFGKIVLIYIVAFIMCIIYSLLIK